MFGPVRRQAMAAAQQAYAASSEGRSLIADLQDGFGVEIELEITGSFLEAFKNLIVDGNPGTLPIKAKVMVDPTEDAD